MIDDPHNIGGEVVLCITLPDYLLSEIINNTASLPEITKEDTQLFTKIAFLTYNIAKLEEFGGVLVRPESNDIILGPKLKNLVDD